MFESLDELLGRKNQRFICVKGWPDPGPPEHVIRIEHLVSDPVSREVLQELKKQFGAESGLPLFYSRWGSLRLYAQVGTDESAYYLAGPDEWEGLREAFEDWVDDLDEDEKGELLPEWLDDYRVIGEIPKSGNYFLLPMTGHDSGCIYEFEHDGFEFIKRGNSFSEFVEKLAVVNDDLIGDINVHTRYRDARPDSQWLVGRYEFG